MQPLVALQAHWESGMYLLELLVAASLPLPGLWPAPGSAGAVLLVAGTNGTGAGIEPHGTAPCTGCSQLVGHWNLAMVSWFCIYSNDTSLFEVI